MDLSNRTPSASMYGISNERIKAISENFSTDYYRIFTTNDIPGVELCSAFKNIYAMAAGVCDGLYKGQKEGLYHNMVAFLFNQACTEISQVVFSAGGEKQTAFGLAGVGDLHVTSVAGRNRRYGEMVGKGMEGEAAFKKMYSEGEYGEGYIALKLAVPWLEQAHPCILEKLPLLKALNNIIFHKSGPWAEFKELIKKLGF